MRIVFVLILFAACFIASTAHADEIAMLTAQVTQLAQSVQSLQTTVEMQQKEINALKEAQNITPPSVGVPTTGAVSQAPRSSGKFTPEIGAVADTVLKLGGLTSDTEKGTVLLFASLSSF